MPELKTASVPRLRPFSVRIAAHMPSGTATSSETTVASRAMARVLGRRAVITSATGSPVMNEVPKSPLSMWPT